MSELTTAASRRMLAAGATLVALATVLGAFGAHALQSRLSPERLRVYETAVRYHFFQALGLLALGLAARTLRGPLVNCSAALVLGGTVVFCGSLYALAAGAPRILGAITPLGGLALIAGWLLFAIAAWRG
jgi:uncharacterized membrane protein YgdD (TMEM256/DUF423 family)